jgi:hypothetical protein
MVLAGGIEPTVDRVKTYSPTIRGCEHGTLGGTLTHDKLLRRQMLYTTELREYGLSGRIRTFDSLLPKQVLWPD